MSQLSRIKSGKVLLVLFITLTNIVFAGVLIAGGLNILHARGEAILGFSTMMASSIPLVFMFGTLRSVRGLQRAQGLFYAAVALIITVAGIITHALTSVIYEVILLAAFCFRAVGSLARGSEPSNWFLCAVSA